MLYILLSVCCTLIVSILLKLAKRYHIDVLQAITWNYTAAIFLTWLLFKPHVSSQMITHSNTYLAVGILLPVIFLVIAASVKFAGIVRTDVAERLSLLVPVLVSFWLYKVALTTLTTTGILVGFTAILFSIPWSKRGTGAGGRMAWLYLLVVFAGMGVIDVMFKQIALFKDVSYTTSIFVVFIISFITAIIILAVQITRRKTKFSFPHILIGWFLGLANFGNIVFYVKAHKAFPTSPLLVFASVNIGVIVTGAIVGFAVFKERLSLLNKIGIVLAMIAIIIIASV